MPDATGAALLRASDKLTAMWCDSTGPLQTSMHRIATGRCGLLRLIDLRQIASRRERNMLASFLAIVAAASGQLTVKDIDQTVEAIEQFRSVASRDLAKAPAAAVNVCRLMMTQSLRGVNVAREDFKKYDGPGKLILSTVCYGYMQASHDVLTNLPPQD